MKKCCFCVGLKDGVTILGFLSLVICIVEWVLSTSFNEHGHSILKKKGDHIVSLIEKLVEEHFQSTQNLTNPNITTLDNTTLNNSNDEKIHSLKTNVQLLLNFVTGEYKHLILFSSKTKQL